MSKRYMMVVRQNRTQQVAGITMPVVDVSSRRELKNFIVQGFHDLVAAREVPHWLRAQGYSIAEPCWALTRTPELCFVTVHSYPANALRVDLADPEYVELAWSVRWTGTTWRVFQLNNPKTMIFMDHSSDGRLQTSELNLGRTYELTARRLERWWIRRTTRALRVSEEPGWELTPFRGCSADGA